MLVILIISILPPANPGSVYMQDTHRRTDGRTDRQTTDLECDVALVGVRSERFDVKERRLEARVDLASRRVNTAERRQVPVTSERRLLP